MDISRRSFLKGSVAGLAGAALANAVPACLAEAAQTTTPAPTCSCTPVCPAGTTMLGDILNPQEEFSSTSKDFSAILAPITIGHVTLKNRIMKSCAGSEMQHSSTEVSPTTMAYYERFCQGGVSLISFETAAIDPDEPISPFVGVLNMSNDSGIAPHRELADMAHKYGAAIIAQMSLGMHKSSSTGSNARTAKLETGGSLPQMQTVEEIHATQKLFIDAAERYYKAGFDGIELNASCNHYFSSYLSRYQNDVRDDEYGPQSVENRARVLTEIIEGIRERVGQDFIIQVLYSAVEGNLEVLGKDARCIHIDEGVEFAKLFEKAGASSLHVRSEMYGTHPAGFMPDVMHYNEHGDTGYQSVADYSKHFDGMIIGSHEGYGALLDVAARVKQAVSIPVGTVGAIDPRVNPEYFNNAIRDGKVDFYLMTRPLMADFHYVNKLMEGRVDEIAPCTHCLTCFSAQATDTMQPMYCRVNAALTRALTDEMPEGYDPLPAEEKKNVMVIGGGPAGMEAARIAAERGHHVTLYERENELGGLMNLTAVVKGPHERIADHKRYLMRQMEVRGVEVVTGQEIDADFVARQKPDAVVVAVGGVAAEPVAHSSKAISVSDLFAYGTNGQELPIGETVVIYGAQLQGGDLAKSLLKKGKKVYLLNPGPEDELLMGAPSWPMVIGREWLYGKGAQIYHNAKLEAVTEEEVTFGTEAGTTVTVPYDTFVDARPLQPNRALFEEISEVVDEVYAVGDCYSPGTIANATARADLMARRIGSGSTKSTVELGENQYTATATGIGDVRVTITVQDGKLSDVIVDTSSETAGIGKELGEQFARQILETGDLDSVSGATVTSNAVRAALKDCLAQAGL